MSVSLSAFLDAVERLKANCPHPRHGQIYRVHYFAGPLRLCEAVEDEPINQNTLEFIFDGEGWYPTTEIEIRGFDYERRRIQRIKRKAGEYAKLFDS